MEYLAFFDAIFTFFDLWCPGCTEEDYIEFGEPLVAYVLREVHINEVWKMDPDYDLALDAMITRLLQLQV